MQTQYTRKWIPLALGLLLISSPIIAGTISRIKVWADEEILFSSDLNAEFNQILNLVNGNLDDDNISSSADISPSKLDATIAGDGLARNGSTGVLSVNDDDSTLTIVGDTLMVKNDGVTGTKLADAVAGAGLIKDVSENLAVNVDDATIEIATDVVQVKDHGITQIKKALRGISSAAGDVASVSINTGTSSLTFANIGAAASLTTTGNPVMVMLLSADSGGGATSAAISLSSATTGQLAVKQDAGSANGAQDYQNTGVRVPCSTYSHMLLGPTAGAHTFQLQGRIAAGAGTISVNCFMVVYEL